MGSGQSNPYPPRSTLSLAALVHASRAMAAEPDPIQALWILVSALRKDLHIDRVGVFAFDPENRALVRVIGVDTRGRAEYADRPIPVEAPPEQTGPIQRVARRELEYYFTNDAPG